jgi:hypothetical protein
MVDKYDLQNLWAVLELSYDDLQHGESEREMWDNTCEIMDKLAELIAKNNDEIKGPFYE